MASAVASQSAPLAGLLKNLLVQQSGAPTFACALRPASVATATTRRLFSSKGSALGRCDDDKNMSSGSEDDAAVMERYYRYIGPIKFFPRIIDVFGGPFSVQRTLGELLEEKEESSAEEDTRDQLPGAPWWLTKEDDRELTLLAPMPGLGKEHVKVWTDQDKLMIKGDGGKELADAGDDLMAHYHRYLGCFWFRDADAYKMDQIRAEMKNGLLKVTVPKVVDEERPDVTRVTVE